MKMNQHTTRGIALLTGGILAVSSLHPTPAHADKSKNLKTGAAILGAASALLILKGKTLPGILAGAGAYYAYKKGQDAKHDENYAQYPDNGRYTQYPNNSNNDQYSQYPTDNGNYNNSYNNGTGNYSNGNYDNNNNYPTYNSYPTYSNPANYPDNNDQHYNQGDQGNYSNQGTYNNQGNYSNQENAGDYSDQNNRDTYSYPTTTSNNSSYYPDYGYKAFSQGHSKSARRSGR